jgi:mitochondrial fusion and transport protein UGO1
LDPTTLADEYLQYSGSDSDDEPSYFTSNIPHQTPTPASRTQCQRIPTPLSSPKAVKAPEPLPPHQLQLRRPDAIFDVISQLWSKESIWGVWKGSNATFLYSVLQSLLENWSRSLLSALLNVPDLGVKDDVDRLVDIASPYPWASLCVAAAAAVATGLILSPLDLVRTRLILTSTTRGSRRTISTLRALPYWRCPSSLVAPTILHSLVHPVLTLSTPLVLRSQFLIDKELSPTTFSVAKFCTSCASLFVKLPLETVLRRGQASVLTQPAYVQALDTAGRMETIVPPGRYNGVIGTMYTIVAEEGSHALAVPPKGPANRKKAKSVKASEVVYRRGQGFDGLWRGWKVSWWGLFGLWTAGVVGGGGEGEF